MPKTRLQELHAIFLSPPEPEYDWVFVYNEYPKHSELVSLWIQDGNVHKFGYHGRFVKYAEDSMWVDQSWKIINKNVVAWKDIKPFQSNF